ncbi:fas-binding factor 1 homolog isoform X2 [Acipenser ruthenus]|uniref:fas-binding factor 1 homolog isoform X2 n=1 Tax=Acipenser ruthenus TaxID=7906 RepID=UPI002741ADC1|nr:fas-binding factor 1 homolog isoform X2 [Acipenser ruthenus]
MAGKQKKALRNSIDDVLGDLLGDDDVTPSKTSRSPAGVGGTGRTAGLPSRSGRKSLLDDDFFSKLAEEAGKDEGSDISEADPLALLDSMKDIDDMDADLFGSKKPSSAPSRSLSGGLKQQEKPKAALSEDPGPRSEGRKPSSAPAGSARHYKKFTFEDDDDGDILGPSSGIKEEEDPLEDLLDDQDEGKDSKQWAPQRKDNLAPSEAPGTKQEEAAPPASAPTRPAAVPRKREELSFDEDGDELIEALGFGESPKGRRRAEDATPQPARSRLDEILGRGTAPRLLERPLTGESKEVQQEKKSHRNQTDAVVGEEDFTFGAYQPTVASTPEGRQSRRQSVRFSTEDISGLSPEKKLKPATPATPLSARSSKPAADWLGLKEEEAADWRSPSPVRDSLRPPPSSDVPAPQIPSPSNKPPGSSRPPSGSKVTDTPLPASGRTPHSGPRLEASVSTEEDDWLAGALSRKRQQEKGAGSWDLDETDAPVSKPVSSPASRRRPSLTEPPNNTGSSLPWENPQRQATPPPPSGTRTEDPPRTAVPIPSGAVVPAAAHTSSRHEAPASPLTSPPSQSQQAQHESARAMHSIQSLAVEPLYPSDHPLPPVAPQSEPPKPAASRVADPSRTQPMPASSARASLPLSQHPLQEQQELRLPPQTAASVFHPDLPGLPAPSTAWCHVPAQRPMETNTLVLQPQVALDCDPLQALLLQQQLVQSQARGLGPLAPRDLESRLGVLQKQLRECETEQQAGEQALQTRLTQMECQVRKLELERDQAQLLLDTLTQRQRQDLELVESTHRTRVKLLEEASQQREAHLRQESEELQERVAALVRSAERDRVDLVTQHQRRLGEAQQERDREVERLRELQRQSILEMKKDHEEQLQRLKRLKDQEIDAVTSATSQTRSLNGVIDQMESFSRKLGDLSYKVESTHEQTAQGLEQGARQRDDQLRVLQDRLSQQQRDMEDERSRLQSVITKMESRLSEQQRLLEKERWRLTAEQSKVESLQRALEEERRVLTQQISMEREELERAKSALLEEQQAVMQRCAEERRKLAAEWTEFHKQEKQRQERTEREASRALERDSHREGSLINLAQEQADIKVKAGELKLREEALIREREAQERERQELQLEKERVNGAALRLRQRAEEMDSVSKLASQKYEEGEHALLEAKQVASEHQARLRSIHQQMERLRQQEQHLHQERLRLSDQRRELEKLRQGIPINTLARPLPTSFAPLFASTQLIASQEPVRSQPAADTGSPELRARLALLRHTAEKDRDFLEDEQFFLETLKKAPYNSSTQTA